MPLKDFYLGLKKLDMGPDELLKRIRIPAPPAHSGSFYIKYTRRNAMDLALLGVSAYVELEGDVMKMVRIALTTAAPTPIRAEKTEALLTGKTAAPELLAEAGKTVLQDESSPFQLALQRGIPSGASGRTDRSGAGTGHRTGKGGLIDAASYHSDHGQ